ncbi:hypothetical protein EJMOOK_01510 [Rhodanobacter sp. Root179]|jgi:hypothetical protein|uniref:hypothetical protein n=1 Tax=unclassified Rhodanobacter TaxID=2621553 RepID=UPI000ABCD96A|nr:MULTISPECIES: hypothetical protein [unclassified Rhodanobacter]
MKDRLPPPPTPTPADPPVDPTLEQQMAECGLSGDERHFLRHLHVAEKQLNEAFSQARQGGTLEARISEVYREMYGSPRRRAPAPR